MSADLSRRFPANRPPTPSLLFYLFAGKILPARRMGVRVPCTEGKVRALELSTLLFAVAFWSLREQGIIELRVTERQFLLRTASRIEVARGGIAAPSFGLEGIVLANLSDAAIETPKDVIRRWFHRDVANPEGMVIEEAEREAIALGYLAVVDANRGIIGRLFLGKTKRQANCGQIATLTGTYEALAGRWQDFQAREPALAQLLHSACASAINSRRESGDAGGPVGPGMDIG